MRNLCTFHPAVWSSMTPTTGSEEDPERKMELSLHAHTTPRSGRGRATGTLREQGKGNLEIFPANSYFIPRGRL